jgi:pyruvate kinase
MPIDDGPGAGSRTDVLVTLSSQRQDWPDPAELSEAGCAGVRIIAKGRVLSLLDDDDRGELGSWISPARENGVEILLDLPGDKPTVAGVTGTRAVAVGESVVLVDGMEEAPPPDPGTNVISVNHGRRLIDRVTAGDELLIADGAHVFQVLGAGDRSVRLKCSRTSSVGLVSRSIALRGAALRCSSPTRGELDLLGRLDPDLVDALIVSFCEEPSQIAEVRAMIPGVRVLAKIESWRGYEGAERIARTADGVLIGRSDLSSEVEEFAMRRIVQNIVELCRGLGRPVLVGSGILESLCHRPAPSMADIADVRRLLSMEIDGMLLSGSISVADPVRAVGVLSDLVGSHDTVVRAGRSSGGDD